MKLSIPSAAITLLSSGAILSKAQNYAYVKAATATEARPKSVTKNKAPKETVEVQGVLDDKALRLRKKLKNKFKLRGEGGYLATSAEECELDESAKGEVNSELGTPSCGSPTQFCIKDSFSSTGGVCAEVVRPGFGLRDVIPGAGMGDAVADEGVALGDGNAAVEVGALRGVHGFAEAGVRGTGVERAAEIVTTGAEGSVGVEDAVRGVRSGRNVGIIEGVAVVHGVRGLVELKEVADEAGSEIAGEKDIFGGVSVDGGSQGWGMANRQLKLLSLSDKLKASHLHEKRQRKLEGDSSSGDGEECIPLSNHDYTDIGVLNECGDGLMCVANAFSSRGGNCVSIGHDKHNAIHVGSGDLVNFIPCTIQTKVNGQDIEYSGHKCLGPYACQGLSDSL